ncbi:MAG TPA: hypothetical protein VNJ29_04165 [Candidatus Nitrosotenuis sp.]|jgi:hypothetical protein|nr:hypothetical protein [Candidatus Nitrosotenuis sp.]
MKEIFFTVFTLLSLSCFVQAGDYPNDESTNLISKRLTYQSFLINNDFESQGGSGSDEGSDIFPSSNEELDPIIQSSKPVSSMYILPMARPHSDREHKIDHYLFQPLLYSAGSAICVGLMEAIYYQSVEAGLFPLEIGLGIAATSLACKAIARWSSGILDYFYQKSEERMLKKLTADV